MTLEAAKVIREVQASLTPFGIWASPIPLLIGRFGSPSEYRVIGGTYYV